MGRNKMINEYGEEFTNEFDKEFRINPILSFRQRACDAGYKLVNNKFVWYAAGVVDAVILYCFLKGNIL